jgi:cytochrome c biogenesis protein CcdA
MAESVGGISLFLILNAGFVTLLTPCGYILLPAFLAYYLGEDATFMDALRGGLLCVLGIFLVFGSAGLLVVLAAPVLQRAVPYLPLIAGLIILLFGVTKLFALELPFFGSVSSLGGKIKPTGFVTYGVVYAFTAAGCTFPIFFSVLLFASISSRLGAALIVLTYALGVAIPLLITSLLARQLNQLFLTRISEIAGRVHRFSGFVLILAGFYLVYYWYSNLFNT